MTPERFNKLKELFKEEHEHDPHNILVIRECLETIQLLNEHSDQLDSACYALDEQLSELRIKYEELQEQFLKMQNILYPDI